MYPAVTREMAAPYPRLRKLVAAVIVVATQACARGNVAPDPEQLVVARVLELNFPDPLTRADTRRMASFIRANLPSDDEVELIVVQFPVPSSNPRMRRTRSTVFQRDSLEASGEGPVSPDELAKTAARELSTPIPVVSYRVDVLGERNAQKAKLLERWVRDRIALYQALDSIKIRFRGTEVRDGNLRVSVGSGTVAIGTRQDQ